MTPQDRPTSSTCARSPVVAALCVVPEVEQWFIAAAPRLVRAAVLIAVAPLSSDHAAMSRFAAELQ